MCFAHFMAEGNRVFQLKVPARYPAAHTAVCRIKFKGDAKDVFL